MAHAVSFVPPRRPSLVPVPVPAAVRVDSRLEVDTGAQSFVVRAAEGFDHGAFLLAAVLVFPAVFFPYWGELLGTLWSLALFALAFALRPVGRSAGQFLRERFGTWKVLGVAGLALAASTAATGVLPAYAAAGSLAIVLLVACRIAQGLAGGACAQLHEAPRGGMAVAGLVAGVALAAVLMVVISSQMVHADFVAWGWRYPFCAALAVHLVALFARVRLAK